MATIKKVVYDTDADANRDPITGEPGSHPVGTGLGTALGATAGVAGLSMAAAAAGSALGPLGTAAGAIIGGAIGAISGHDIAEDINPTVEEQYWSEHYQTRGYVQPNTPYDNYRPAYRYGVDSYVRSEGRDFDAVEPELRQNWNQARGASNLDWEQARPATRDAYDRLYQTRNKNADRKA